MTVLFPEEHCFVNLSGSFVIGLLWGWVEIESIPSSLRNFIFIGILGGFTTFSTYTLESFGLFRNGEIKLAMSNVLANNVLGIVLVFAGFIVAKYIINLIR